MFCNQLRSLQVHGKITQFYATTRLFVGFTDGIIIAFDVADLSKRVEMNYHNATVTAIHEFGGYIVTGCNDGVVVLLARFFSALIEHSLNYVITSLLNC